MRRSNATIIRGALQVAVLVVLSVPTNLLLADTTLNSGTTTVSTGTNFGTRLYVASTGTATMNVMAGGYATDSIGYLGYSAGSNGAATVSGGTWAMSGDFYAGSGGTGTLTMTGGLLTVGGALTKGIYGTVNLNSGGTLQIGVGSTGGVLLGGTGSIVNNGTLIFSRSDASTHSGFISGTGNIQNAGTGTTTLTGQTSFTNGLGATAGRLIVGSTAASTGCRRSRAAGFAPPTASLSEPARTSWGRESSLVSSPLPMAHGRRPTAANSRWVTHPRTSDMPLLVCSTPTQTKSNS
jgi:T5SS/PEP-CTERM-associated repeat protein